MDGSSPPLDFSHVRIDSLDEQPLLWNLNAQLAIRLFTAASKRRAVNVVPPSRLNFFLPKVSFVFSKKIKSASKKEPIPWTAYQIQADPSYKNIRSAICDF
jgi:hypothetical protein